VQANKCTGVSPILRIKQKGAMMKSTAAPVNKDWIVYILYCRDNTLYTGITKNVEKRLITHNKGNASRYTRARLPVKLLASSGGMSKGEALRLEIKIKKLPKKMKLAELVAVTIAESSN
jgi:putative endonuclease